MQVAILGGGMGGLAAALKLSQNPGTDVTLYQRGWRLGGKGASGRNHNFSQRIEEHGLHILMGFYDNAFEVLKDCYARAPAGKVIPWPNAFAGWDHCTFAQEYGGSWDFWEVEFPPRPGNPWDGVRQPDFVGLIKAALQVLLDLLTTLKNFGGLVGLVLQPLVNLMAGFSQATLVGADLLIETLLKVTWKSANGKILTDRRLRWLWMGACFIGGNLIGVIRGNLVSPAPDFGQLDGDDYRAWLQKNLANVGCPHAELTDDSPFVRGLYDLAFSAGHTLAAGVTLSVVVRLALDYRGHMAFKMNGGMGDVVFAPMYMALEGKVRFRFFHRVTALHLNAGKTAVESIDLERQVGTPGGYDPFVDVGGRPCWPSEPKKHLLESGYQQDYQTCGGVPVDFERDQPSKYGVKETLVKGTHFDVVVLAIPVGALSGVAASLSAASQPFQNMVGGLNTVRTGALQVWVDRGLTGLKCPVSNPMIISYRTPCRFNSYADMSQVLAQEQWPSGSVGHLAYFCDAIPDPPPPDVDAQQFVEANAGLWLKTDVRTLWPAFVPQNNEVSRYVRANWDGSDRYVLSEKAATSLRLNPDASGFYNLALAGDWVRTPLNSGCLEAAVMGGLQAAEAIISGKVHG